MVLTLLLVNQSALPKFRTLTLTLSLAKPWFQLVRVLVCASIFLMFTKILLRSLFYGNFKVQGTIFLKIYFAKKKKIKIKLDIRSGQWGAGFTNFCVFSVIE